MNLYGSRFRRLVVIKRKAPAFYCLVLVSVSFIAGFFTTLPLLNIAVLLLFLLVLLFFLYLFLRLRFFIIIDILLIGALILSGMLAFNTRSLYPVLDKKIETQKQHHGMVLKSPTNNKNNISFIVRLIDRESGMYTPYAVKVFTDELLDDIKCGDIITFSGKIKRPSNARNPGGFMYRDFLWRQGVQYVSYIHAGDIDRVGMVWSNYIIRNVIFPFKEHCIKMSNRYLGAVHSSLLQGLTVGERGNIPAEIKHIFSDAGIIHVLAVSGLHVGILSFFLFILLRSVHVPFRMALFLTCIALIFYVLLIDLRAPVVRATLMFICIMLGMLSQRRIILLNIIAVSALVILAFRPLDLFDIGFQLSYAATFSIVLFQKKMSDALTGRMQSIRNLRKYIIIPFTVSLSAQLGSAPIVAFYFFRCSVIAPLSNLVIIPFVSLAIPSGFLMVAAHTLHPVVSRICAGTTWFLLNCIIRISHFLAEIPYGSLQVGRPSFSFLLMYYFILVGFFALKRKLTFFIVALLLVFNIFIFTKVWKTYHPRLTVYFLDVGQGDAAVIEFPGKEVCIIDGGRRSNFIDYGERVIIPFFCSRGISHIHTIIATHPDVDHYGGLISVIEHFPVGKLLVNGSSKESFLYKKLLITAQEKGTPVYTVGRGDVLRVGQHKMYVLNPPSVDFVDILPTNEGSIVLKFGYGKVTFLFTGDFPNKVLKLPHSCLSSTVLKFPHHGASFFELATFLRTVRPEIATISVGRDNPFGHPKGENIQMLKQSGCQVYRTDTDGAITLITDGKTIRTTLMIR